MKTLNRTMWLCLVMTSTVVASAAEPGTTLLQFLAEAGGLSRFAAEKRVQLRRVDKNSGQETVYLFNYRTMGGEGSISAATVLAPGDVVFIPERRLFE